MDSSRLRGVLLAVGSLAAFFFLLAVARVPVVSSQAKAMANGDVVLHPAILKLLYGGDSFLAANVETARILTSGRLTDQESLGFFVRLHEGVSRLNPCHEDAYYMASAFLSSGGAVRPALDTLGRAAKCRFWDEWAAFMLGLNQHFFAHDPAAAVVSIREAALRAADPKVANHFNVLAINIQARQFDDAKAALRYLAQEKSRARDPALKEALEKRIGRLQGLVNLRQAQADYESRSKVALIDPADLLRTGVLKEFPVDPLGIGYEFSNGRFELKQFVLEGQRK